MRVDCGITAAVPAGDGQPAACFQPAREISWPALFWFCVLLGGLYGPVLYGMAQDWVDAEDMRHGVIVPLVAGYIIWQRRDDFLRRPLNPSWWGVTLIVWGFVQLVSGTIAADFFLVRTAFLITLAGVLWTLGGTSVLQGLAFPLCLLVFMIRLPLFLFSRVTLPLQLLASQFAAAALGLFHISVALNGTLLEIARHQSVLALEAGAGIRCLYSLSFAAVVYAYFAHHRVWMRSALSLAAIIPCSLLGSAAGTILTVISGILQPGLSASTLQMLDGPLSCMLALAALVGVDRLFERLQRLLHANT